MIDTQRILEGEITPSILAEKRGAVGWLTHQRVVRDKLPQQEQPRWPTISEPPHAHPAS